MLIVKASEGPIPERRGQERGEDDFTEHRED